MIRAHHTPAPLALPRLLTRLYLDSTSASHQQQLQRHQADALVHLGNQHFHRHRYAQARDCYARACTLGQHGLACAYLAVMHHYDIGMDNGTISGAGVVEKSSQITDHPDSSSANPPTAVPSDEDPSHRHKIQRLQRAQRYYLRALSSEMKKQTLPDAFRSLVETLLSAVQRSLSVLARGSGATAEEAGFAARLYHQVFDTGVEYVVRTLWGALQ